MRTGQRPAGCPSAGASSVFRAGRGCGSGGRWALSWVTSCLQSLRSLQFLLSGCWGTGGRLCLSDFFFFFKWPHLQHLEAPGPGMESVPGCHLSRSRQPGSQPAAAAGTPPLCLRQAAGRVSTLPSNPSLQVPPLLGTSGFIPTSWSCAPPGSPVTATAAGPRMPGLVWPLAPCCPHHLVSQSLLMGVQAPAVQWPQGTLQPLPQPRPCGSSRMRHAACPAQARTSGAQAPPPVW